ncbi:hypothetical protein BJ969_002141 [Saccharopolyspora gloriosae]|uniref:Uncharacterized protein n=1 Tax=Saccharopolyspora gloriosae TaxID=455344 RepID=A0A840NFL8_9PSEU|nr:hypothetical protein [Saccharopolyspora gloriosae]
MTPTPLCIRRLDSPRRSTTAIPENSGPQCGGARAPADHRRAPARRDSSCAARERSIDHSTITTIETARFRIERVRASALVAPERPQVIRRFTLKPLPPIPRFRSSQRRAHSTGSRWHHRRDLLPSPRSRIPDRTQRGVHSRFPLHISRTGTSGSTEQRDSQHAPSRRRHSFVVPHCFPGGKPVSSGPLDGPRISPIRAPRRAATAGSAAVRMHEARRSRPRSPVDVAAPHFPSPATEFAGDRWTTSMSSPAGATT